MWMLQFIVVIIILKFLYDNKVSKKLKKTEEIIYEYEENNLDDNYEEEMIKLPYKKKKYLLSIAEKNFFNVLQLAIKDKNYYICPMVRLADLIYTTEKENWGLYFNRIKSKHIDFVLCNANSMSPEIAIELDDSTHFKEDRIERDMFVDQALEDAGMKIVRFRVKESYQIGEIIEKLNI